MPRRKRSADRSGVGKSQAVQPAAAPDACGPPFAQSTPTLLPLFTALNALLARAVERQAQWLGPSSLLDPWRGLHLDADDVRAALSAVPPGVTLADDADATALVAACARTDAIFARVADMLHLSAIEIATVAFLLAPDVDLRYERVYGYLQDDISCKRPSLDLLARLLCPDIDRRANFIRRFDLASPLCRFGLVEWHGSPATPLIARPLGLDALWRNFLLGREELDPSLAACARLVPVPSQGLAQALADAPVRALLAKALDAGSSGQSNLRVLLVGPHGAGKARLSGALARELGLRLLVLDVRDLASKADVTSTVTRAQRASILHGALMCVHGVGRLTMRDPQLLRSLAETLAAPGSRYVLWLAEPLPQLHAAPLRAARIDIALPDAVTRRAAWGDALDRNRIVCSASALDQVAARFTLSVAQIAQAAADVTPLVRDRATRAVSEPELAAAARALCGTELAQLAQRIAPEASFDTLVITPEAAAQLREIRDRVANRETVRQNWTHGSLHARNVGVTALFAGPSGTGKTLAAEVIASELGYDLFRIDLSAVVSKYIGETEKNLDRVFSAAEHANAVLLFDEADALFGKRSEVKDAHDRYANIEIAYLLQKMEQFDGLAILSTNLKQNLDEAFARRLTFTINFAFPEVGERLRLWERLWPPRAPRADDVDFAWFAQEFPMSGGNIRNAVLAAVHLAVADGQVVGREHVMLATRREFQKLGKNLVDPARIAARRAA